MTKLRRFDSVSFFTLRLLPHSSSRLGTLTTEPLAVYPLRSQPPFAESPHGVVKNSLLEIISLLTRYAIALLFDTMPVPAMVGVSFEGSGLRTAGGCEVFEGFLTASSPKSTFVVISSNETYAGLFPHTLYTVLASYPTILFCEKGFSVSLLRKLRKSLERKTVYSFLGHHAFLSPFLSLNKLRYTHLRKTGTTRSAIH